MMGGPAARRPCDRLSKCKWFRRESGTLYKTGLPGNKTIVQQQTATNEWIANRKAGATALALQAGPVTPSTNCDAEKDRLQDLRLYGRTPDDPYVRAWMVSREHGIKEQERKHLWTASLEKFEQIRARDKEKNSRLKNNGTSTQSYGPSLNDTQPARPETIVWTRPGTVATGALAAGGGHHMSSRSSIRESLYMLPNPNIPLTDVSDYERIISAQDEQDSGRKLSVGRDFLGCRRVIEPVCNASCLE